jgi:hypothetical protein
MLYVDGAEHCLYVFPECYIVYVAGCLAAHLYYLRLDSCFQDVGSVGFFQHAANLMGEEIGIPGTALTGSPPSL